MSKFKSILLLSIFSVSVEGLAFDFNWQVGSTVTCYSKKDADPQVWFQLTASEIKGAQTKYMIYGQITQLGGKALVQFGDEDNFTANSPGRTNTGAMVNINKAMPHISYLFSHITDNEDYSSFVMFYRYETMIHGIRCELNKAD